MNFPIVRDNGLKKHTHRCEVIGRTPYYSCEQLGKKGGRFLRMGSPFVQAGFVGVSFKTKKECGGVPQCLLSSTKHFQGRLVRCGTPPSLTPPPLSCQLAGKLCLGAPSRGKCSIMFSWLCDTDRRIQKLDFPPRLIEIWALF